MMLTLKCGLAATRLVSFAAAVLAGLALWQPAAWCQDEDKDVILLKKGDRVIFGGDSLTQQGITQPGDGPAGYVNLVREALQARHKDLDIVVIGTGSGGLMSSNVNPWLAKKA